MDFYQIKERCIKKGTIDIYPDFKVCRSKDLMVRGKSFYAIWDEEEGLWSTDEYDVQRLVDRELDETASKKVTDSIISVKHMSDFSSRSWLEYRNYINHVGDNSHQLDTNITFSNSNVTKKDYISRRLAYALENNECPAFNEIIGTLYDPEERAKLEWAIGSIISGDSKSIQKFIVLYGDGGTGKSTILNIIQMLFDGYYTTFEAKALTSSNNMFSTEAFKSNPLVAIQHDGDLSRIEDNSKLNSIISHEEIVINEKHKPQYTSKVNCFLFMATNKPVKITDAKSGIIRRLIDVRPSGNKLSLKKYNQLMEQVKFELGSIAYHCLEVYKTMGKGYYSTYRPVDMMYRTDPFFNFVEDSYDIFLKEDGVTLKSAYAIYKEYCDSTNAEYKLQLYRFRDELKNYFKHYDDRKRVGDIFMRSWYSGFITKKFDKIYQAEEKEDNYKSGLVFDCTDSIFDNTCQDYLAQYGNKEDKPIKQWSEVITKLSDIDTKKLHYVRMPETHIVIDFDIKGDDGNKSFEKNLEEANKWPPTYAELSKSGAGIHLHYIYTGDTSKLCRIFADNIEIKVFVGLSSLRRKLTKCNDLPIANINSGLPLKKENKVINFDGVINEKGLRTSIRKALRKEIHPSTKPNIDFISKVLDDAYASGIEYDLTDMRPYISAYAAASTNQALYCIKTVSNMKFKSKESIQEQILDTKSVDNDNDNDNDIVFYDVEVFKNVFIVCYKHRGKNKKVVKLFNPSPSEIEDLLKFKLVGFNCRRYDNHMLYARMMGYTNEQLYLLSQKIISGQSRSCFFGEAYNISYTDVYDFSSAANKKSLKKWMIELNIHHQENSYPWDEPLAEEHWAEVGDYCANDVDATEIVFDHLSADWTARKILAEVAELTVNDTTNTLTTRTIFGMERKPQSQFNYRDLSKPVKEIDPEMRTFLEEIAPEMLKEPHTSWLPFSEKSVLPYFDEYKFERGKSIYRDEEVGEGGYVFAIPDIYVLVALLDIMSMHPFSILLECLFGYEFTKAFYDIVNGRVAIKHEAWDIVNKILNGKLTKFVNQVLNGIITSADLANGLKTAINSVYGLTAASFDNAFRDPRNKDNIVAKRGALFMIDLKNAVQEQGYTVAHIKTDSIKIPNATPEIIEFVMHFGKRYGYTFEYEALYSKMCLVNGSTYIAKYADDKTINKKHAGEWTATATQFQVPYVFKTLFSKETYTFEDFCETKNTTTSLYLDMNENLDNDEHSYHFIGKIGRFCPIKAGCGGGELLRQSIDNDGNIKYSAVTGTKGYRWMESEMVKILNKENDIDKTYYTRLVDDAIDSISKYGDFEWFISED